MRISIYYVHVTSKYCTEGLNKTGLSWHIHAIFKVAAQGLGSLPSVANPKHRPRCPWKSVKRLSSLPIKMTSSTSATEQCIDNRQFISRCCQICHICRDKFSRARPVLVWGFNLADCACCSTLRMDLAGCSLCIYHYRQGSLAWWSIFWLSTCILDS